MLRHLVLLRFVPDADPGQVQEVDRRMRALPDHIPGLLRVDVAHDAGLGSDHNFDLMATMDFRDEDAWREYAPHPAHQAMVEEAIEPILAEKGFVQLRSQG